LRDALLKLKNGETLLAPISLSTPHGTVDGATSARLSPREQAVLRLVAGGYSNKEIGRVLNISDGTVKNHITEILQRLDARDRTHAVLKAIGAHLL
jgi:DNA-binding NarL/FixJ family response regulator